MIVSNAEQRTANAREEVDDEGLPFSKQLLGELPEAPKTPHVEQNVENTGVKEPCCNQSPVFSTQREWTEVGAPTDQIHPAGVEDVHAGHRHADEGGKINCDQSRRGRVIAHCS